MFSYFSFVLSGKQTSETYGYLRRIIQTFDMILTFCKELCVKLVVITAECRSFT